MAAILLFVFFTLPGFAWASASSIAYGSDDSWAWATRATQREANQVALQKCNETTLKKDCALDRTKAIVRAEGGGRIGLARSAVSLADARKNALVNCGNTSCKVLYEITKSGFYSLAQSEKDKDEGQNYYLVYADSNSDEADKDAMERCTNLTSQKCKVIWSGAIAGTYQLASAPVAHLPAVASEKSCRPNTQTVRCASQCTNGNCVVTYENGCKVRVQVHSRFDPFTNQWNYPAPSC